MPPKSAIFESHPTGISGVFRCGPGPNQARFETLRMEVAKVWVGFPRSRATEVPEKLQSGSNFVQQGPLLEARRVSSSQAKSCCLLTFEILQEGWGELFAKCQSRGALQVTRLTLEVDKRR